MPESTRLVRDDAYEEMGSSYQRLQVTILDAALRENGVSVPTARQEICESFLFAIGNLHDQGWLKTSADSKPIFPLLCFTKERGMNNWHSRRDLSPLNFLDNYSLLSHGCHGWAFLSKTDSMNLQKSGFKHFTRHFQKKIDDALLRSNRNDSVMEESRMSFVC